MNANSDPDPSEATPAAPSPASPNDSPSQGRRQFLKATMTMSIPAGAGALTSCVSPGQGKEWGWHRTAEMDQLKVDFANVVTHVVFLIREKYSMEYVANWLYGTKANGAKERWDQWQLTGGTPLRVVPNDLDGFRPIYRSGRVVGVVIQGSMIYCKAKGRVRADLAEKTGAAATDAEGFDHSCPDIHTKSGHWYSSSSSSSSWFGDR